MRNDDMNNGLMPLTMCCAMLSLDQYVPGWTLADFLSEEKPGPRRFEHYVRFNTPFSNTPLVHVGIAGFDIDNRDTGRLGLGVENISAEGFSLVIKTWMHTRVYQVEVSWLAIGNL